MAKRASTILAETFGWDVSEVNECRYQRYVSPMVFATGDRYYAVSKTKPKHDVGGDWVENRDQYGTRDTNVKIWVCEVDHELE